MKLTFRTEIESFPRFPLQCQGESEEPNLSDEKNYFVRKLPLDEDGINELEHATGDQAKSEKWKSECKYRFTASKFHLIAHRQRNHETDVNTLMYPKSFTSRHTSYQLSHTESNFDAALNIDSVVRHETHIQEIESFPRFPLQYQREREREEPNLSDEKKDFVRKLYLDEDGINELEHATRDQAKSVKWRSERKYRFTASKFHFNCPQIKKS